jgi:hypothetical protein
MAGAIGVCVAALYYMINLRETSRNRKATLANNILQTMFSEEGLKRWISLLNMQWTDFDDFTKKYDSTVNEDNYVKRTAFILTVNYICYLVKQGLIDIGSVYEISGEGIMDFWIKFKPIYLELVVRGGYGKDFFDNVEYLANLMINMKAVRDPNYKGIYPSM